jgi:cytochrome c oxidase subunit 4
MSKEAAHHVLPVRVYVGVWLALLVFTGITVGVSYFDFGSLNLVVAMLVATMKASMVALIFMHLWWDEKFNLVLFVATLLFVSIFFGFTSMDLFTRGLVDPVEKNFVKQMPPPPTAGNLGKKPDHGAGHTPAGDAGHAAPAPAGGH